MYSKNFSMDINYPHTYENNKIIIEKFKDFNDKGNEYISMSYLMKNIDMSLDKIYDGIYELLEKKIIEVDSFSRCPYCLNDIKLRCTDDLCKCKRCKKIYHQQYIIEKFRILKEDT